jgi:hypothetical protein
MAVGTILALTVCAARKRRAFPNGSNPTTNG